MSDNILPEDAAEASLVGRVWVPELLSASGEEIPGGGPCVVLVRDGVALDLTPHTPTMAHLLNHPEPLKLLEAEDLAPLGPIGDIIANSQPAGRDPRKPYLLSPFDLQALKACGVTFVRSMLERVIEEQAKGAPERAAALREELSEVIGAEIRNIKPGSPEAAKVKETLSEKGLWSQYLEVGLGPDAEVFTKAQPMASVGAGADVGLHPSSTWNNPEPEVVMVARADGVIVGATLGNDVNLRDVEGRSALLLGRAKDNNGSCALGPFIRLFDSGFGLNDARAAVVALTVEGEDGFVLKGDSHAAEISRDMADLVSQAFDCHHYPDGLALFTGTMFAPIQDRDAPGQGFTHKMGDIVTISSPRFGALVNRVGNAGEIAPWTFGTSALMDNLAKRGLL
ncbi:fumarylacetoacetate hydrolase family protein [Hwanghaeella sp.]|uniref:fumarylacetoacetate hydrolase family protein n=1 Tax=Hwanghaeella sp. TaxID=2605943 RepID=UPI003CCC2AF6